ncbi:hypothetical protein GCM10027291_31170 [Telluribacter humicola]
MYGYQKTVGLDAAGDVNRLPIAAGQINVLHAIKKVLEVRKQNWFFNQVDLAGKVLRLGRQK